MTDYEAIYRDQPDAYDRMVRAEDCDGELGKAFDALDLAGKTAVEIGVGTGRVTELLLDRGCRVRGFERAPAMLALAERRFAGRPGLELARGDARELPVADASVDLGVGGWVLGHLTHWEPARWQAEIARAIDELFRVVRPGGRVVILETLGTGTATAAPPNDALATYYAWLEEARGFERRVLRTDYRFADAEAAAAATGFFFGEAFAAKVRAEGWARIPEHTGMWITSRA